MGIKYTHTQMKIIKKSVNVRENRETRTAANMELKYSSAKNRYSSSTLPHNLYSCLGRTVSQIRYKEFYHVTSGALQRSLSLALYYPCLQEYNTYTRHVISQAGDTNTVLTKITESVDSH